MNLTPKPLLLSLSLLLVGCGEDLASGRSNRPTPGPTPTRTDIEAETPGLRSQLPREKGSPVLTYAEEVQRTLQNTLPVSLYRPIPDQEKDDESSATTVGNLGRPLVDCGGGTSFATVTARLEDCLQKNTDRAGWAGSRFGTAGEGSWRLVTKNGSREFWLDASTNLIWSPILTATNWCRASGNIQGVGGTVSVDCQNLAGGTPSCDGEELDAAGTNVRWRLPTRSDFLQADLNGLRAVLPKEADGNGLWTATLRAGTPDRSEAWVYQSKEGTLAGAAMTAPRSVRCVGIGPR